MTDGAALAAEVCVPRVSLLYIVQGNYAMYRCSYVNTFSQYLSNVCNFFSAYIIIVDILFTPHGTNDGLLLVCDVARPIKPCCRYLSNLF